MKKKIGTSIIALMCLSIAGCSGSASSEQETTTVQPAAIPTEKNEQLPEVPGLEEPVQNIDPGADVGIEPTEESTSVLEETTTVEENSEYNTNLFSTWGRLYTDSEKVYFVELSADEKTQIIYSIGDSADAVPEKIYEYPSLLEGGIGYISCSFMAGYDNTIVYVDETRGEGCKVCYVTKDGSESGEIGELPGRIDYIGHNQDEEKVYYRTYVYAPSDDEEAGRITTIYEVDINNRTISEFNADIELPADNQLYIVGVTKQDVVYAYFKDEIILCTKNRASGEQKEIAKLPESLEDIILAGDYVIYKDGNDDIIYSMNIRTGENYELCRDCEIDFEDGEIHVVNCEVYYLKEEKDLYSCTIKGENNKLIAKENGNGYKYLLGSYGDWIFFKYNKSSEEYFYRIRKTENAFPDKAIVYDLYQSSAQTPEITCKGAESKEELITIYLKWMNGDATNEEFLEYFNADVYFAYMFTEEFYSDVPTLKDGYVMLENEDKQTEKIKEFIAEEGDVAKLWLRALPKTQQNFAKFGPYEVIVDDDKFWDSENGYSVYKIYVEDEEDFIIAVEIKFAEKDGYYYWAVVNDVA